MNNSEHKFNQTSKIGIIGAGRLGSSLAVALNSAGMHICAVSTRSKQQQQELNTLLCTSDEVAVSPQETADRADIVFIATTDDAVSEVVRSIAWRREQAVIHCAGALPISVLGAARDAGAATGGFHPLQTFPERFGAVRLTGIPVALEADEESLMKWMEDCTKALGSHAFHITSDERPLYHAAAVMVCGLQAVLAGIAADVWSSAGGMDPRKALGYLLPLMKSTIESLSERGFPASLTGPIPRGDMDTLRLHIEAIDAVSPTTAIAYAALSLASLPLLASDTDTKARTMKNETEAILSNVLASR